MSQAHLRSPGKGANTTALAGASRVPGPDLPVCPLASGMPFRDACCGVPFHGSSRGQVSPTSAVIRSPRERAENSFGNFNFEESAPDSCCCQCPLLPKLAEAVAANRCEEVRKSKVLRRGI